MSDPTMHLQAFVTHSENLDHVVGSWRHRNNRGKYDYNKPEYWQDLARICERGKFDSVFVASNLATYDTYKGSIRPTVKWGGRFPIHDPVMLVPYLAEATENLGVAVTMSVTYYEPYLLARKLSTLDHLTNGRIGWNIVTSYHENEAANMGVDMFPHDERYDRADEYMEVCTQLWEDSWDDDAVIKDPETGVYADPDKINRINYEGEYFDVPGPHYVRSPSPQGKPVLFQAGQSDRGREFAAKHAEGVFCVQLEIDKMRDFVDDVQGRAEKYRDDPEEIKFILGMLPFVAETEADAKKQRQEMYDLIPYEGAMAVMSAQLGYDFSQVDEDKPLSELDLSETGIQGMLEMLAEQSDDPLKKLAKRFSFGFSVRHMVGTPEQIADEMEEIVREGKIDGFNITQAYRPGTIFDFVEKVVPVLQDRGLVREEYTGDTFRENLMEE